VSDPVYRGWRRGRDLQIVIELTGGAAEAAAPKVFDPRVAAVHTLAEPRAALG
jgi:hypothetical protein